MVPALLILFVLLVLPATARAYLDPGTGSMMLQIVIGTVLAVTYTIKVYWRRITQFFRNLRNKPK